VEIDQTADAIHIQSLVVHPRFFRQGIGMQLMEFVLKEFENEMFTVETGVDNGPATALYLKLGFFEVRQWDTDHGVRKIRFEKKVGI
jgi:ribosomal protein S18 acetylase RimI-like enzyme